MTNKKAISLVETLTAMGIISFSAVVCFSVLSNIVRLQKATYLEKQNNEASIIAVLEAEEKLNNAKLFFDKNLLQSTEEVFGQKLLKVEIEEKEYLFLLNQDLKK